MALKGGARSAAIWFAVAIVLPFVPALFHRNGGGFTNFLADAGAFVLLALGLNIVVGFAGLLDLGYAAFFAIGSYTFAMLASPQFGIHVPFWVMLFVASGVAAVFGILLGAPTLRLRGDYLAIVTLGFGEIVPQTFLNLAQFTGGPNGISLLDQPAIGAYKFGFDALPYYFMVLALIALAVWLANNMRNSRLGRAWMAIREDELAAAHMGINTTTTKLAAFAMGASFSGLAGCAVAVEAAARVARPVRVQRERVHPRDAGARRDGQHPRRHRRQPDPVLARALHLAAGTNFLHGIGVNVDLTELALLDLRRRSW